jgi:hypothetical protein
MIILLRSHLRPAEAALSLPFVETNYLLQYIKFFRFDMIFLKHMGTRGIRLFLILLVMYAGIFAARGWWLGRLQYVHLETTKPAYFHDEFVEISLRTRDPGLNARWQAASPRVEVLRLGQPVETIAAIQQLALRFDPSRGAWTGRWPCPWNAEAGAYELRLLGSGDLNGRLAAKSFQILRRRPLGFPPGLAVLTLESVMPFKTMRVPSPSGEIKDWRGLIDWAQYIGADAFWVLGGQTPGAKPGEIWLSHNLSFFPEMARECHRRGIKFGVYVMAYLTMSEERLTRYEYALDVRDARALRTRAISLRDPRRPDDVADFLGRFREMPEVDYLGLDYIRNALGGYELVDDFYAEMPGVLSPPGWERLSPEEKMAAFARKKIQRKDLAFIDAWQWWRAHKTAAIVRRIKERLGDSKPLWAFTLTWDKGWHHGQDPVMMNDAGVDADALMLYEATAAQFDELLRDWNRYIKRADAQLLVGDVIDWPLHQMSPDGPEEFYRRSTAAIDRIYSDGPAVGVFLHDLSRALWGRLGPWGTRPWMEQARRVVQHMKARSQESARVKGSKARGLVSR